MNDIKSNKNNDIHKSDFHKNLSHHSNDVKNDINSDSEIDLDSNSHTFNKEQLNDNNHNIDNNINSDDNNNNNPNQRFSYNHKNNRNLINTRFSDLHNSNQIYKKQLSKVKEKINSSSSSSSDSLKSSSSHISCKKTNIINAVKSPTNTDASLIKKFFETEIENCMCKEIISLEIIFKIFQTESNTNEKIQTIKSRNEKVYNYISIFRNLISNKQLFDINFLVCLLNKFLITFFFCKEQLQQIDILTNEVN